MTSFLTIVAILATIAFFLYVLAAVDNSKMDKLQKSREERESKFTTADPRKVYSKSWNPEIPRPRVCPSCGMLLKKDEYLYASISDFKNSEGKRQAHIYGCKYCYLGEAQTTDIQRGPEEIQDL